MSASVKGVVVLSDTALYGYNVARLVVREGFNVCFFTRFLFYFFTFIKLHSWLTAKNKAQVTWYKVAVAKFDVLTQHTWSDSKVMRLVPKKSFILLIYQLRCGHLQSASLVPAHTFSSGAAILCSIPGTQLVECLLGLRNSSLDVSVDSKRCPFTADFAFWNKRKSPGARSGE